MGFSIQQIGNFPKFWKDEFLNLLYVAWIAFYGACMIILMQFKKTPELDIMLPTTLPTDEEPFVKPYAVSPEDKKDMRMLKYLFSYDSDFPYNIETGIEFMDGYFFFLGGMGSYLYSSFRYVLKSMIDYIDVDNYFVDVFSFYILPTALFYIALVPIIPIISFCGINFISCFTQPRIKNAYIYAFAWIFNLLDYDAIVAMLDLSQFPGGLIRYIMTVVLGFLISFVIVPGFSLFFSLGVWIYVIAFLKLMPLFFVYFGGLSWKEVGSKILEQVGKHYAGLTILFLYYSIAIAYKNLDQKVAWGTKAGIIILILILLKIFSTITKLYKYYNGDIDTFPNPITEMMNTGVEMKDMKKTE